MKVKALLLYSFLTLAILFTGFNVSYAQVRETDVVLTISPEYPNPNQQVTATLSSYSTSLDKALISWSADNQENSSGIGKKVFLFTMGDLGSTLNLTVTINTVDGQSLKKTMIINPTSVDMLWEASDAYTPPFYKGKALAPSQGEFKVVVMPNLTNKSGRINENNLSYTWKKDGDIQSSFSGWGKNFLTFDTSYLDKENLVEVEVSDVSSTTNSSGSTTLRTYRPEILFYANNPILGIKWEKSLENGFQVGENGETLVAEPYFFSPKNIDASELSFIWSINDNEVQMPRPKNMLSVKPEAGQSGSAKIKLLVENINMLFQSAEKQFNVSF